MQRRTPSDPNPALPVPWGRSVWERAVGLWNWMVQEAGCGLGYAKQALRWC